MRIAFTADGAVTAAIERLGRTEDVRWSPCGRRLALIGYLSNRVLILEVRIAGGGQPPEVGPPEVALSNALEITSSSLDHPHGVAWLDEHTLIVANRHGEIGIFALPPRRPDAGHLTLDPVRTIGGDRRDLVKHPGSISVFPIGLGLVELLVCSNFVNHLSRHLIDTRDGHAVLSSESLISDALRLPDGAAHSRTGRWIAVSSHHAHCVLVFRNDDRLHEGSVPDGVLKGVGDPHGLVFTPDEKWILAADAGAPFVHAFSSTDGNWEGERDPVSSFQIISDACYARGRFLPGEGGPKGIDLTRDGTVLVATCQEDRLIFLDVRAMLGTVAVDAGPAADAAEAERARLFLLRYLGAARSRVDEATAAIRRTGEREVQLLLGSRWWRVIAPLRRLSEFLRYAAIRARHRIRRATGMVT